MVIFTSTPGILPSLMAMPIRALVKLLAMDQLASHDCAFEPGAYHSDTITPWCTTTTPWVFLPFWKA